MKKILLTYKGEECVARQEVLLPFTCKDDQKIIDESENFNYKGLWQYGTDIEDKHREPFRTKYMYLKIKEKTKEMFSKYNYVFGLSTGWGKDVEYKRWCEELINFSNSFEGQTIGENQITFPTDPWGNQEVLDFNE